MAKIKGTPEMRRMQMRAAKFKRMRDRAAKDAGTERRSNDVNEGLGYLKGKKTKRQRQLEEI